MNNKYNIDLTKINDSASLKQLQKELNESIDTRLSEIELDEFSKQLSESSFGYIKSCFEEFTPFLFESKGGRKLMNDYITLIKGNKNLSTLHSVYESVRRAGKDTDVDYFVNNLINTNKQINTKTLKEDVKKLGIILGNAYKLVNEQVENLPEENTNLDNSIEFIVENQMSTKNLPEFGLSVKYIKEDIEKREHSIKFNNKKNIDTLFDSLVESFNEKYNGELNENEIKVVNEILTAENSEEVFKKYVNECLTKIEEKKTYFNNMNDIDSSKRLDEVYRQISNKEYSKETLSEDINNILEITELFG